MAYNVAHDVKLPNSKGAGLGFLMYPIAENASGRLNSYAPDDFKYQISARETTTQFSGCEDDGKSACAGSLPKAHS
jgi:hypothetical protein